MKAQLFNVSHTTTYEYQSLVTVAHHLLRLTPRSLRRQMVLSSEIGLEPAPVVTSGRRDYFGNDVQFVTLEGPHRRLIVTASSRIAVTPAFVPETNESPAWESVRYLCRSDRSLPTLEATEFTFASPLIPISDLIREYAASSFFPARPILEAALDLSSRIHADFKFDAAATNVSTPLEVMMEQRRGVCQDFAHFLIACLRSFGLPARYVSGYLETLPPPGQPKLVGVDASHAWVSFFCPGLGWLDIDPTNDVLPSMQHITLAWGRDYGDVSPVRGVLLGGDEHVIQVGVDVTAAGQTEVDLENSANCLLGSEK
jgi:transglutaminase-like putative cysteine protease